MRHADLARQQNVLARLRHRAVGRGHHENGAVHLRRARDHVLDVVRVAGAVDVRVVALGRLVLLMVHVDRHAARPLLGRVVDLVVLLRLRQALLRQIVGDRRGQRRLAVVDVADRSDVDAFTCGFVRSNFALDMVVVLLGLLARTLLARGDAALDFSTIAFRTLPGTSS